MEVLKLARTQHRRVFTKSCNEFDLKEDKLTDKEKVLELKIIEQKSKLMILAENDVKQELFKQVTDEKILEKEIDESESYLDRWRKLEYKLNELLQVSIQKTHVLEMESTPMQPISAPIMPFPNTILHYPKIKLPIFDGNIKHWLNFWGQFKKIHNDPNIDNQDKFTYLSQAMQQGSIAEELIKSFPPSGDSYEKAVKQLQARFGNDELLIQVYVRDLLSLILQKQGAPGWSLRKLYDQLESKLRALEVLGVIREKYAAMLFPLVESSLPDETLKVWERCRTANRRSRNLSSQLGENSEESKITEKSDLDYLLEFLQDEVESEERISLASQAFDQKRSRKCDSQWSSKIPYVKTDVPTQYKRESTAAALISSAPNRTARKFNCLFCDRHHLSQDCSTASGMDIKEKREQIIRKGCCLVCLKPNHMAKSCRSEVRCIICKRRHYALLCPDFKTKPYEFSNKRELDQSTETKENRIASLFSLQPSEHEIYLKTIMIRLRHKEKQLCVRALLDDGSHRSYVERSLVKELSISPSGKEVLSQGLFGGGSTPEAEHGRYHVTVESLDGKYSRQISVLDQYKICTKLPRIRDSDLIYELISRGIELTDVGKDEPPIRVLIGADVLGSILTGRIEVMRTGISAVETLLGWTVMGLGKRKEVINMVTLSLQNFEIPKLWQLETLGITDPIIKQEKKQLEEETMAHFYENIKINENKRYEVALPWIAGHPLLVDNYDTASTRLHSVTKRLIRENILESYDLVLRQWEKEGIIETVSSRKVTSACHYLPHRPVLKLSSATTKIRPVFDASQKQGNISLNECLSTGPSLLQKIPQLLTSFRSGAFGIIADIRQAFLQISLNPNDRDVLRFLWWADTECKEIKIYRHCRVVFGVSSSPFLLNATIKYHLDSEKFKSKGYDFTIGKLKEGFYVDNLITSVNNMEELRQLKSQAQDIMKEGGFELRCWAYNTEPKQQEDQMVLGLKWNITTDELYCNMPKSLTSNEENLSKRKLLSIVNSIYDPIGFTAPATLLPKLLLQEAWINKLGWDETLPAEIQKRYKTWVKALHLIEKCTIPRRMFHTENIKVTLHIFTDASAYAYAACAFLRSEGDGKAAHVQLIAAKARVAPIKRPTIPRLELLGAAIGARLAVTLRPSLKAPWKTFYWTDSNVVLCWIVNKEPWNTFVGNRVKEIRSLTDVKNWRHVPGEMNPADLPSRSCGWSELLRSRWWEGPDWLKKPEENWPFSNITLSDEALLERRNIVVANVNTDIHEENIGQRFLYFSKYPKILRMTAWMIRFCHNSKLGSQKFTGELSVEEIERAEKVIIRMIQREWSAKVKEKYSKSIQFYEDDGILKVTTKLILGDDSDDFQRPAVLPDHPIVRRMIEHYHTVMKHSGVQVILSRLRERFWIPRGRRIIREVLNKCVPCKRYSSKPVIPETAPLPANRTKRVAAFDVTGVDLAGPVYLRRGVKAWIVLFSCGVYRAIHLELVTSLSTESFMQALRRFFARRGRSSILYTDNGSNFVGASKALQSLDWDRLQKECALQQIKWHFSPPSAPWYGGWWERMIRSVKLLLKKCLGKALVNYEEMLTLLCECESAINGRPLTYLSDDPNELAAITPAHFIQDIKGNETADLDLIDSKHLLKRVRYLQFLRENLRKRFQKEYLSELIRSPDVPSKRRKISPGEIVIIGSDNSKRLNWPLGQVVELFPGKDKVERVAKLRVANGYIIRPLQRLFPLEINSKELPEVFKPQCLRDMTEDAVEENTIKCSEINQCDTLFKQSRCGRKVIPPQRLDL